MRGKYQSNDKLFHASEPSLERNLTQGVGKEDGLVLFCLNKNDKMK